MKHILLFFLLSFLSFNISAQVSTWDGSRNTEWYDPAQTEYYITSAAEFAGVADLVNKQNITFEGKTIHLETDIDLKGTHWTPIGGSSVGSGKFSQFKGTFNGNLHTISNLFINADWLESYRKGYGLFGIATNGAKILNLILEKGSVYSSTYLVAALVGSVEIFNGSFELSNIKSNVTVNGSSTTGSMIGYIYIDNGQVKLEKLINLGKVTGTMMVGGLIGDCEAKNNSTFIIQDSYVNSNIQAENYVGGITGSISSYDPAIFTIKNCFVTGSVKSATTSGGIVGQIGVAQNSKVMITNCLVYLNELIGGGRYYQGRISSIINKAQLKNNYAVILNNSQWENGANGRDGANWEYKLSSQPVNQWNLETVWEIPDYNYLPKIAGMPNQPDIPFKRNAVGVEAPSSLSKNIYTDNGSVVINTETSSELSVYSLIGKLYVKQNVSPGETRISLPNGLYIVKLGNDVKKIIIQ